MQQLDTIEIARNFTDDAHKVEFKPKVVGQVIAVICFIKDTEYAEEETQYTVYLSADDAMILTKELMV
jgi:hypothetical protein